MKENNKSGTVAMDDSLKWHFFNMYCLALSDDEFDISEKEALYSFGVEHGVTPEQINDVILTTNLSPAIPDTIEGKIDFLYDLARMAWADGKIEPEERNIIKKCVVRYGFLRENADQIVEYLIEAVKQNKTKKEIINEITEC